MAKPQILIVEDDKIITMELEKRLEGLEYHVVAITSSGEDAIERAASMHPDLVLMDIRLKGPMDGVEAAAEIRDRFDIPVVYLTAYADERTLQRAKITEPFGYVLKPFEEQGLHTAIEMALYKHRMERKLRQSEQWLSTTLKSIGDAVIATDARGYVTFMNPIAEVLTGWKFEEIRDKKAMDTFQLLGEESHMAVESPVAEALRQGAPIGLGRHLLLTRDGQEIPIDGSTALIRNEQAGVDGVVLVFRDMSQRKHEEEERERLQAQLFQAQKMEAVGVLAGGIAHEFNNLMTTIMGRSSLMLADLEAEDALNEGLGSIKRAAEQAASLTRQILALSRKEMPEPTVLDLNTVIVDMEEMVQRLIGKDIDLVNALDPGFRCVRANPAQIEQVIMNLIVNAREAMPAGGQLTLKTENVSLDQDQCDDIPGAQPGTYVRLSVTDTGRGMDQETMQHIFEPFFSTKTKGTGLGLTMAATIVRQHQGWIEVHSEPGEGSTFQVYLPAFLEDLEYEVEEPIPLPELLGQGEQILLVEDDTNVRAAVVEMLLAGGYGVIEAGGVAEALEIFEREGEEIRLIFSDVVLPDGDGLQLVDALHAINPRLPVLLTSGYTDQRAQWVRIRERNLSFIQKPYGLSDLLPIVHETLHGLGRRQAPQGTT